MGLVVHLVKAGKGSNVVRYAAPFSTSSDTYFGAARTTAELVEIAATMGLDPEEEAEVIAQGRAILDGEDPAEADIIDMAAFSDLYERLYIAVGFVGSPARRASSQNGELTADEVRLIVTGIRFLREFYDEGEKGIGLTGFGFVAL